MKPLPEDAMIIIPMRNTVLFPGVISPITVGRPSSVAAAQEAVRSERKIGFLLQREPNKDQVKPEDLYWVGTAGQVIRYITGQEGTHHLVVQGTSRSRVLGQRLHGRASACRCRFGAARGVIVQEHLLFFGQRHGPSFRRKTRVSRPSANDFADSSSGEYGSSSGIWMRRSKRP